MAQKLGTDAMKFFCDISDHELTSNFEFKNWILVTRLQWLVH